MMSTSIKNVQLRLGDNPYRSLAMKSMDENDHKGIKINTV